MEEIVYINDILYKDVLESEVNNVRHPRARRAIDVATQFRVVLFNTNKKKYQKFPKVHVSYTYLSRVLFGREPNHVKPLKFTRYAVIGLRNSHGFGLSVAVVGYLPQVIVPEEYERATVVSHIHVFGHDAVPSEDDVVDGVRHFLAWASDRYGTAFIGEFTHVNFLSRALGHGRKAVVKASNRKSMNAFLWPRRAFPREPDIEVEVVKEWR